MSSWWKHMTEEQKDKQRESVRKWRKSHSEELKATKSKYYSENKLKVNEYCKEWRKRNQERVVYNRNKWEIAHPDKVKESKRKWDNNNKEKREQSAFIWRTKNRDKTRGYSIAYKRKRFMNLLMTCVSSINSNQNEVKDVVL